MRRNYLSHGDCVACLDVAFSQVRQNCSTANGGQVIYQGCFLSSSQSESESSAFTPAVTGLITDLVEATPKINGFFAATTRPVFHGSGTVTVYAVAQCIETISQKDCQNCLKSGYINIQSCPPASEGSSLDANCFLRYSDTSFFDNNSITDITAYLRGGSSSAKTTITGAAVGCLCLLLVLAVFLYHQLVRKPNIAQRGYILGLSKLRGQTIYNFKDLKSATGSFSEDCKIGEGGFGDVYKGITRNGDVVAVKKLSIATNKAKADFESEVRLVNFGLARLVSDDQSHLTTGFAGTWGYTAPEYAIHGHLSEKVDTYSFGVVVLEIVSGRRCSNLTTESSTAGSLLEHAWNLYENDMHSDLIDESLDPNEYIIDTIKKIIEIALMCTQSPTSVRPTMSEVLVLLTNDISIQQNLPEKPTLF
ncbi:Cysteine-rich receptor-like protein kinase [Heracleum sosnowskyi]|uniref:Cysteine-rich receptor-like protein kinase n=1 Tax=Heracleum sosnowskyi TaxID=360622 RepID=A0AAD8JD49_9APIA|nr:Cysteine-rich receptor-like protein kinase [Heracleum sosnowskyi]